MTDLPLSENQKRWQDFLLFDQLNLQKKASELFCYFLNDVFRHQIVTENQISFPKIYELHPTDWRQLPRITYQNAKLSDSPNYQFWIFNWLDFQMLFERCYQFGYRLVQRKKMNLLEEIINQFYISLPAIDFITSKIVTDHYGDSFVLLLNGKSCFISLTYQTIFIATDNKKFVVEVDKLQGTPHYHALRSLYWQYQLLKSCHAITH